MAGPRLSTQTESVHGVVQTIYHAGADFSAGRLRTDDGGAVRFAGKVYVRENDPVSLRGRWEEHPKYGRQFAVDWLDAEMDLDPAGPGAAPEARTSVAEVGALGHLCYAFSMSKMSNRVRTMLFRLPGIYSSRRGRFTLFRSARS